MTNDRAAWTEVLRRVLTDDELAVRVRNEARSRKLPTWAAAAEKLRAALPEGLRAS
jgi:hypothetical protein